MELNNKLQNALANLANHVALLVREVTAKVRVDNKHNKDIVDTINADFQKLDKSS